LVVVSGLLIREIFTNEVFSFIDAFEISTGITSVTRSIVKSNKGPDTRITNHLIAQTVNQYLPSYSPIIYHHLCKHFTKGMDTLPMVDGKKDMEHPYLFSRHMVANTSKCIGV
jgi:hypothetical protein